MHKRSIIFFLIIFVFVSGFVEAANNISLPGFGKLSYVKNGSNIGIEFDKIGKFNFKGTINPLSLTTRVNMGQLKNFPGYKVISKLSLEDITIKLSRNGFYLEANANTGGALKTLCRALKITEPRIGISVKIARDGFALEGELDFSDKPVVINIIPKQGTRMMIEKLNMSAEVGIEESEDDDAPQENNTNAANSKKKSKKGKGLDYSPSISISLELRMRPTKWDPDLKIITELSYDLVSQEITGSGSMVDTWSNPLGLSKFLPANSISMTNTAMEIGWIPGSPSPTNIGFYLEKGKFFGLEFAMAMSLAPADRQVALMAEFNKITMNDFTRVLREGFKLKVPDVFPQNLYIKDAKLLFSPNGGEVGEFEIEEGFALQAKAKMLNALDVFINFKMNTEEGFSLEMNMDARLKEALMNEISKVKFLAPVMNKILSTFEVKKVYLLLKASTGLVLQGKTECHFKVLGKNIKFSFNGKFDVGSIKNKLIEKVKKLAGPEIAAVAKAIGKAYNKSKELSKKAWNETRKVVGTAVRHLHSKSKCDNNCVPDLAKRMYEPILAGSNHAIQVFHDELIDNLVNMSGRSIHETRVMRSDYIKAKWDELIRQINNDWDKIDGDRTYVGFYIRPSSATNGGHIYRRLIGEKRKENEALRDKLWKNMMEASYFTSQEAPRNIYSTLLPNVAYAWKNQASDETLFNEQGAFKHKEVVNKTWKTGSTVLVSENKKYVLKFQDDGNLVLYKYNNIPLWDSETWNKGAEKLAFQGDGNLVIYNKAGKSIWNSKSYHKGGKELRLQNDGNLILANGKNEALWTTNTWERKYYHKVQKGVEWKPDNTVLVSPNRKYRLIYQGNGVLSLLKYGKIEIWHSDWDKRGTNAFAFQDDGNLVISTRNGNRVKATWASNTYGKGGKELRLQNDGNIVLVNGKNEALWSSNTWERNDQPGNKIWKQKEWLPGDTIVVSEDKRFKLVFQPDGNLVLYKYGTLVLWHSNTSGQASKSVTFQTDGNLCMRIQNGSNTRINWASNSYGKNGEALYLQNDGNLVIHAPGAKVIWSTNTGGH